MHYVRLGDETLPSLLLVHGSLADWSAWRSLLEESSLVEQYNIIVIDRPPYNGSNGKVEVSFHKVMRYMISF